MSELPQHYFFDRIDRIGMRWSVSARFFTSFRMTWKSLQRYECHDFYTSVQRKARTMGYFGKQLGKQPVAEPATPAAPPPAKPPEQRALFAATLGHTVNPAIPNTPAEAEAAPNITCPLCRTALIAEAEQWQCHGRCGKTWQRDHLGLLLDVTPTQPPAAPPPPPPSDTTTLLANIDAALRQNNASILTHGLLNTE
jgi:hypothetical protein